MSKCLPAISALWDVGVVNAWRIICWFINELYTLFLLYRAYVILWRQSFHILDTKGIRQYIRLSASYQMSDFLMLNQIWNVGLPSFWILCIQIWVSAFSLCPYLYHVCFLFSSTVCYSFSLQELHQSIGRPHRSLHMLHCSRRSSKNFVSHLLIFVAVRKFRKIYL